MTAGYKDSPIGVQAAQEPNPPKPCERCGDMFYHPKTMIEDYRQQAAEWQAESEKLMRVIEDKDKIISHVESRFKELSAYIGDVRQRREADKAAAEYRHLFDEKVKADYIAIQLELAELRAERDKWKWE